ncbi:MULTISPECIES: ABC transporter permease [Paenibacillus]|uniref:ABC transporter permease n=1 Tax=Paenibacillus campinasensis TaxID=66347 RepID=A0ABW9T000_9BACL|nr:MULTISPECIES: ABC transporter permease [Paenibacillus]MUG66362.1 ABC transporter permease [Paenibacillus campinasensis]PAK54438.1 ABC transporter permease [Paenibacillus sp. 7541]
MRAMNALIYDIRFQFRHGFYAVYVLVSALYVLLLYYVSPGYKERTALLLTFSDPGAIGLILAGGIVLLEKDQGVHDSLFVTPLRLHDYLLAKALSIAAISTVSAWGIQVCAIGLPAAPVPFTLGVLLTSALFTLLSIGIVARARSMNGFIWLSQLYSLPLAVPLLGLFQIGSSSLYRIFPTQGSLVLLGAAHEQVMIEEYLYALVVLSMGVAAAYGWAYRSFERRVLARIGKGADLT